MCDALRGSACLAIFNREERGHGARWRRPQRMAFTYVRRFKMHHHRRLVALIAALLGSLPLVLGLSASSAATTHGAYRATTTTTDPVCKVFSLPSFVDQGEFTTHSSVADIVRVGCEPEFAGQTVQIRDNQLY